MHIRAPGELASGRVDTAAFLTRTVASLRALDPRPDAVLLTGDLVDSGESREEYVHLRRLLAPLDMPCHAIPGNHDGRATLREVLGHCIGSTDCDELIQYVVDYPELRLVFLDTVVPGRDAGLLDAVRLAWLDERLSEAPSKPTLIAMHHPPFRSGIAFMDELGCDGADALAAVLHRHPQVERVVCGHLHRNISVRFGGTIACSAPSTAHQIALDLRPREASQPAFNFEPAGYLLHLWQPGTGLVTHACAADRYPGPFLY